MNQYKRNLYYLLLFLTLHVNVLYAQSKQILPDNLQLTFLKDSITMESNSFEFNSCSIVFTGQASINVDVRVRSHQSINVVSPVAVTTLQLNTNQQQIVPIRIIASGLNTSEWQQLIVQINVRETNQEFLKSFWVKLRPELKWKAGLQQQQLYLPENENTGIVAFWIENTGTMADEYRVKLDTKLDVKMDNNVISLQPGERKLLSFSADLKQLQSKKNRSATVNVVIRGRDGSEKLFVQHLSLMGSRFAQEMMPWKQMPLSVELAGQFVPDARAIVTAGIQGQLALSDHANIRIDSRIYNLTDRSRSTHLGSVQYSSAKTSVTAGSMLDFHHFLINGNGLKVERKWKNALVKAAAIKSIITNTNQYKLEGSGRLSRTIQISSDNFSNLDHDKKVYSILSVNAVTWQPNSSSKFTAKGGLSQEQVNTWKVEKPLRGNMFGYEFRSDFSRVSIRSMAEQYSGTFPGFNRGFTFHHHEAGIGFGRTSVGAYYIANKKLFTDIHDSLFSNLLNINNREYAIKGSVVAPRFSISVTTGYATQQQDSASSITVEAWRTTSNILWRIGSSTSLSLSTNINQLSIKGHTTGSPIMAMNTFGSLQHKKAGVYFQYNKGPFYYFETKEYLLTKKLYRRVQIAPFMEQQWQRMHTSFRWQMLYNQELPLQFSSLAINQQLVFAPPALKMEIGLNSSYNFQFKNASFVVLSVRKALFIPVIKNKVSHKFTAIFFKDKNGNNILDDGEERIKSAQLLVNEQLIQTNNEGEIYFSNIGGKPLKVDLSQTNVPGWIPKYGAVQHVNPSGKMKTWQIPFKVSRIVTGKLHVIKDDKSESSFDVSGIRLTASDAEGNNYYTITDQHGNFSFNLPDAVYLITLNPAVFDEKFRLMESTLQADLVNNQTVDLQFVIRERKRQINIQKVDP